MILVRAALAGILCLTAQAGAQTGTGDKPGPMQSGTHVPAEAPKPAPASSYDPATGQPAEFDPAKLFATVCGWCHLNGGRVAGKGPQLMNTERTDAEIMNRIRTGKPGQMPAFGSAFNEEQLKAIVAYIRGLKP